MCLPLVDLDDTIPGRNGIGQINIDNRWRPIIEPIVALKDAIDRASILGDNIDEVEKQLLKDNKIKPSSLMTSGPDRSPEGFRKLIIGPYESDKYSTCEIRLIPYWSVFGWLRRRCYVENPAGAQDAQAAIDVCDNDARHQAYVSAYGGIPLFFAGEGKNRGSLHRRIEIDQKVSRISMFGYPKTHELLMRPVLGCPNLVALRFKKKHAMLPFPHLSVPLLKEYGVRQSRWPWFGFFIPFTKVYIDRNRHVGIFGSLPSNFRNIMLRI